MVFICGYILYAFVALPVMWNVGKHYLRKSGKNIVAVVTEKEVYLQDYHVGEEEHLYKYEFTVNGKAYENSSGSMRFKTGDSISVRYWPLFPSINMPVYEMKE